MSLIVEFKFLEIPESGRFPADGAKPIPMIRWSFAIQMSITLQMRTINKATITDKELIPKFSMLAILTIIIELIGQIR